MTERIITFHAGQRIVCVDATPNPLYVSTATEPLLRRGKIYVVRAIDLGGRWKPPGWGVHLKEILVYYPRTGNHIQWALHPRRFRAAEGRPTDIAIFREMLTGQLTLPLEEKDDEFRPRAG